ncbi:MAG: hypothetical protein CMI02_07380 [Oceanospirillaceae bacterium]|nr:hypothetical protein [Oceanospirillaceae bacterium]
MASKNDLALAVLEDLGVVAAGENPTNADAQLVIRRYNALHEMLVEKELAYWESAASAASDTIPQSVKGPLTVVLANQCAKAFGKPRDYAEETIGMNQLSAVCQRERSQLPTESLYF